MIIATKSLVYKLDDDGRTTPNLLFEELNVRRVIEGKNSNIIALENGEIILFNEANKEKIKSEIKDRIDSLCIINENPLELLIGCTPPNLYRQKEQGAAKRVKSFEELSVRDQWYTPWGGPAAVRSMSITSDGWVYADIHVGSIMRSPDQGQTWEPVTPTLHKDVHEVTITPAANDLVYANTYLSVYISSDKGRSWEHKSRGLNNKYGRGISVNLKNPNIALCGVSDGPSGTNVHGLLYLTEDRGRTWTHINEGFPDSTKKNIDTFHIAYTKKETTWVTDENRLYKSIDNGRSWEKYWDAPEEILMISVNQI